MADDNVCCGCGCGTIFTIWLTLVALKLLGILELSWLAIMLAPIWLTILVVVGAVLFAIMLAACMIVFVVGILCVLLPLAYIIDIMHLD